MFFERPKEYISNEKQEVLWAADFFPNFRRNMLVNKRRRIMISFQYACKKSLEEIKKAASAPKRRFRQWTFFFIEEPSRYVKKELLRDLGL